MRKVFTIPILLLAIVFAKAQERPATGAWTAMNLHVNFSIHLQWHNDAGYRTLGVSPLPLQYLFRTGIRYNFNKQTSTAAGIAFFFTKTDFSKERHEFGPEFRFWEELNHEQSLKKDLQLLLRFRAEQRFFEATTARDKFTGYRFRLRPGFNQKISDQWSIQLTDEYMRQIANHKFLFDQNRLTVSGIYHFNKTAQLQAGYLWIIWPRDQQHILTFTFTKIISLHGS